MTKEQKKMKRTLPRKETKQEATAKQAITAGEKVLPKEAAKIAEERRRRELPEWTPRTSLGKAVLEGKVTNIETLFEKGMKITEPQIVDVLIPDLRHEIILIGGVSGKGGGKRRTSSKRTTRMHKSGRRFRLSAMAVVGNGNGYVGMGKAHGPPGRHRDVIEKAITKAKLNIMPVRRGCGSWECACGTSHSLPFESKGRSGSVHLTLKPAPKGVGLVVMDEVKKVMRLAGIKDVWCKSRGQTTTRHNTIAAVFDALSKINRFRMSKEYEKAVGLCVGKVE